MDQIKFHKIEALTQSTKSHYYLIKLIQLLVLLSVFSFFIPPSSLLAFLYHLNLYFSTFSLQLFTHTIDKNCMFLLCNGLLVFVGITRSLSGSSSVDESSKYVEANEPMMLVEKEVMEKIHEHDEQNTEAEHAIEIKNLDEEGEWNIGNIVLEGDKEQEKGDEESIVKEKELDGETGSFGAENLADKETEFDEFMIGESVEEEEVVEEPNLVLSTEELNKKFDDFIRKMKEDLRIEAQKQLLMV